MARLARSLEQFRGEINAHWPGRDKHSDGTIGDAAHAGTWSDHNPNGAGVICAYDLDVDLDGTDDSVITPQFRDLLEHVRLHPPIALKYVLFERSMYSAYAKGTVPPFTWRSYSGPPHTKHAHFSVGVGPDGRSTGPYDDVTPWLAGFATAPPTQGDLDMTPGQCRDKVGRKWFFIVGTTQQLEASVDGAAFFPIGGIWTSGCDAMTEDDGRIVITGRAADGQLQQCIVYTDGNTVKPPGTAPEFELLGGHLYPPG